MGCLVVAVVVGACGGANVSSPALTGAAGSPVPTGTPTGSANPSPSAALVGFPTEILGLPVQSVTEAIALRDAGKLDGRAVAVAGYYVERATALPCPARCFGRPSPSRAR